MLHKIVRQLVQPVVGGYDFVVLAEQFFQKRSLVGIEIGFFHFGGDAVIEIRPRNAKLFAAVLVDEADSRLILFGTLEVIAGDVPAEDAPGQVVVLEQRGTGEPRKDALGNASRIFRANFPPCERCASSEMTMMSSRSLYGCVTFWLNL